jgi:hypothetical protein
MKTESKETWYHGSPLELTVLAVGSTVTQNRLLAMAFSHKPSLLVIEDDGRIRHSGEKTGLLYVVDEEVSPEDVILHPRSSMAEGLEWLTQRPIRVQCLGVVEIEEGEMLSAVEVEALRGRAGNQKR